jgi:hypothetical protein
MSDMSNNEKWLNAFVYALLFVVISNPITYSKIVNPLVSAISGQSFVISDAAGCPTPVGLFLHTVVFFLLARGIMEIPFLKLE